MNGNRAAVETSRRDVSTAGDNAADKRFRGTFRIESTRLPNWDYAGDGWYFVTICTRGREPFLGTVADGEVVLSQAGRIVDEEWRRTAEVRDYVVVDQYVVMPNHLHGLIQIRGRHPALRPAVETSRRDVSTAGGPRLIAGSLGAIIGQFKSVSTKRTRAAGDLDFGWQPRFYDHIVRDEDSLGQIRRYIEDNPRRWEDEQATPANLWM